MKYSGIGGQAVLEGIMMKNGENYAVAVRTPEGNIELQEGVYKGAFSGKKWTKVPFIRGVFAFIDSLILGVRCLMYSAQFDAEEIEKEAKKAEKKAEKAGKKGKADTEKAGENGEKEPSGGLSKGEMTLTLVLATVIAVGLFMVLPTVLVNFLKKWVESETLLALIEGFIRLGLFLLYLTAISRMEDIRRTYMYHGSEHKCINCLEHGLPLTVENVMKSSKEHKRCGTSFLFLVMAISILLFMLIRVPNLPLKILSRILLIPVIAGISYEVLRFTGRYDNLFTRIISRPGMWIQGLTTKEPTEDMVEVAIEAVDRVFDWKAFLKENFPE
ncbi:MAG: DUF1385 domain-containing protein [Lachnospiraceae bacterium]|nr:DUF1385 domain-containing protein [Lachnospiraceae bacterium]